VEQFYDGWHVRERGRTEHSHPGFAPHVHGHIKLATARPADRTGPR